MRIVHAAWLLGLLLPVMFGVGAMQARANGITPKDSKAATKPWFTVSGVTRAFYFGRTNGDTCLTCKPKGSPNATAFNFGGYLHGQINIPHSPWAVGATYFGAYPFGANALGPAKNIGYNPQVDNSVPGYPISILGESYIQYKSAGTFGQSGKVVLRSPQSPWANAADTRITPTSFQGTLLATNPTTDLSIGAMYMARFRSRVTSAFNSNTLLTSCNTAYPSGKGPADGASSTFTVPSDTCNHQQTTYGFTLLSATQQFGSSGLIANAYRYQIYDHANMSWVTAQYNFAKNSESNPYIAAHFLEETNQGRSVIGSVNNHTTGGLFGFSANHRWGITLGFDSSPYSTYVVPSGACTGTSSSPTPPGPGAVFGGVGDTTIKERTGLIKCYGGGLASPYTAGYTSDPLFTTSLTQGFCEVSKPGTAIKTTVTWQSNDRRLKLLASDAFYDYSLPGGVKGVSNRDARAEFDVDATYFFSPVRPNQLYQGFSLRQRYGDRTQPFAPFEFKSSRTQLEYDL